MPSRVLKITYFFTPNASRRRFGRCREDQGVALSVVRCHTDHRLVPHVVDANLGTLIVECGRNVFRVVEHGGQLFLGWLAIPAASDGREPANVEDALVQQRPRLGNPRPLGHPPVDDERPKVPRPGLHLRHVGRPELLAVALPAGQ